MLEFWYIYANKRLLILKFLYESRDVLLDILFDNLLCDNAKIIVK